MGQFNLSLSGDCWFVIITYVGQFNLSLSGDCWFVIITYCLCLGQLNLSLIRIDCWFIIVYVCVWCHCYVCKCVG